MSGAAAGAELVADGGAAAFSDDDFFRSRPFLEAEGTTHTLRIESGGAVALLPLLVREIPGTQDRDAISPYGYPGARLESGVAPDPRAVDLSATGLVSVFVRERIGQPSLAGGSERSRVQIHDPGRERALRPRLAEQVRAAERAGWSTEVVSGPRAGGEQFDAFAAAYTETMRRTEAAQRYFFSHAYLGAALAFEHSWLLLARDAGGVAGAAAIAARSDGFLHYFLGGTADSALAASPFKNVVVAMIELADRLGLPLNLGGGVTPGDGLERFKRGFANHELPFVTHEIVCHPGRYEQLSAGHAAPGGFFPAYRG